MAHRTHRKLLAELATSPVKPGQHYRHYKTGTLYQIKDIVFLEATDSLAVSYFDPSQPELVWIRDLQDFMATIHDVPRFRLEP